MDMTDLTALIDKIEGLTGPDRAVDAEIWCVQEPDLRPLFKYWNAEQTENLVPRFTASIDAAVLLCERVLPGWDCFVRRNGLSGSLSYGWVSLRAEDDGSGGYEQAHGATPAITLCLAILRALSTTAHGGGADG